MSSLENRRSPRYSFKKAVEGHSATSLSKNTPSNFNSSSQYGNYSSQKMVFDSSANFIRTNSQEKPEFNQTCQSDQTWGSVKSGRKKYYLTVVSRLPLARVSTSDNPAPTLQKRRFR